MTPHPNKYAALLVIAGYVLTGCSGSTSQTAGTGRNGTPASLIRLGDDLRQSGDAEGAASLYRAAAGQDGRNATALERLGQASMAHGDSGRSEQAFRAALAVSGSAEARRGLAMALLAQRQVDEALPILAALADEQPDPSRLRAYGVALDMAGRQKEAQDAYRRGLKLAPADANLHGNLALSLAIAGQVDAALGQMRAARLSPLPDPRQEVNGVLLLAIAGREAEARQQGNAALGAARTEVVLRQADQVLAAPDAASRAAAFGLFAGSASMPPATVLGRQEAAQVAD